MSYSDDGFSLDYLYDRDLGPHFSVLNHMTDQLALLEPSSPGLNAYANSQKMRSLKALANMFGELGYGNGDAEHHKLQIFSGFYESCPF